MDDELKAAANKKAREEKKQALLQDMHARYVEELHVVGNEPAPTVAQRVHAALDGVLERDRSKDRTSRAIRCGKGCDHCCKVPVEVFPHEAALLARAAREAGIELDVALLMRQSRFDIDTWRTQPAHDKACVFLDNEGACKAYASRPNACRKLFVLTEPELCDEEQHGADRVGRWISWEAEILGSAALEVFGAELMPNALLAALRAQADSSQA